MENTDMNDTDNNNNNNNATHYYQKVKLNSNFQQVKRAYSKTRSITLFYYYFNGVNGSKFKNGNDSDL